jgi:ABC-type phosphate transport system substrate-binding protein
MKNIRKYLIVVGLLLLAGSGYAQKIKIIVNESNDVTSVSKEQLSRLFLKKTTKWDNGTKVTPVDLVSNSDVRESFCEKIHGKSISAIKAYWQKKIFTGKGIPPVELKSDTEIIEFVRSNPGAVAYVSASTNTAGVKVIEVTK